MPRVSDAHKEARRAQIVDAAIRCFHRNGFHPTTMDDIVRESGLSAGAVYTYFRSKDDLIVEAGSHRLDDIQATIAALASADPVPTPAQVVRALVDRVVTITVLGDLDIARIIVHGWGETLRNDRLRDAVHGAYATFRADTAALVRRWQLAGLMASEVDPDEAAPALLSLMLGFIVQRAVVGPVDPAAYARGAAALLAGAPVGAPARADAG